MNNNKTEFEKVTYKSKQKNTDNLELELKNLQRRIHSPKVDLIERDQYYLVRIELPGVTQDSIKIQIKEHQIVLISGSKNIEDTLDQDRIIYKESKYNNFVRRIKLPSPIKFFNLNQDLNLKDGILYLQFEKVNNIDTKNTNQNFLSIDLTNKVDWCEL